MTLAHRKRPRIGDVIEVATPKGLAYAQFTHKHDAPPRYGPLIRVLPGSYEKRPDSFGELVLQKERFFVFFPLGAACARGLVRIVANKAIPEWARSFPILRSEAYEGPSWYLWDGRRKWRVFQLTAEERGYSPIAIWNDTLLIERIVDGWSPADEP